MTDADDTRRCYDSALRILGLRWNSVAELRRKLARKKFEAATIDAVLARLAKEKWLDDARFAESLVRERSRQRIGRRRIARELGAAGVENETATRVIKEQVDPETERVALHALREKKRAILIRRHGPEYMSTPEGRKKLAAYLLNQGYDFALVFEAVGNVETDND